MSYKRVIRAEDATPLARLEDYLQTQPSHQPARSATPGQTDPSQEASYAEGYEAGFRQGLQTVLANEQSRIAAFEADLRALTQRVESAVELWFQKAEQSLIRLAKEAARRIVCEEIQLRPEVIETIVRDALRHAGETTKVRVRVNPFDLPTLEQKKEELLAACANIQGIEIVGDESLSRGSTIVETEGGLIDATVESKVDALLGEAA
ncbi:MAG: hypothetical protein KatS3mg015_0642 [Fimbriimonadales bacterium]|nr:MAG: hypothetical protein KatS3mg015_0642 [Fimbriimonadales bacterium]